MGVELSGGLLWEYSDTTVESTNGCGVLGLLAEYNFVTKDNFRWYCGTGLNYSNSTVDGKERPSIFGYYNDTYFYQGVGYKLNTGILVFIQKRLGLNFNIGYDGHYLKLKSGRVDSEKINLSSTNRKILFNGGYVAIGIVIREPEIGKNKK